MTAREPLHLLGARFEFESDSSSLLRLVDAAYAGLPVHRLSSAVPRLRVRLLEAPAGRAQRFPGPPELAMLAGNGLLAAATRGSSFVAVSPQERSALVVVSRRMLASAYHARYEALEFAVFTVAARVQGLVPLHAACVGRGGQGLLLMGPSGSGKSTVALHCLLRGFELVAEDSVFASPSRLLATGVANYLHARPDSLRWIADAERMAAIRRSPVIRRRSGARKFEVNMRCGDYRLAAAPQRIAAVVFLSAKRTEGGPVLEPVSECEARKRLGAAQAYAAGQPSWASFQRGMSGVGAFELRRGRHPLESVEALSALLESASS